MAETNVNPVATVQEILDSGGPNIVSDAGRLVDALKQIATDDAPLLYDWLESVAEQQSLLDRGLRLAAAGWHEAAYWLLFTRYDQTRKRERAGNATLHKGAVLHDIALLCCQLRWLAQACYFAWLATLADVLWEHRLPRLHTGGAALHLLSQFESITDIERWREYFRKNVPGSRPIHAEALLASTWFPEGQRKRVLTHGLVSRQRNAVFEKYLLQRANPEERTQHRREPARGRRSDERGDLFEAAVGLALARTPGFRVTSAVSDNDEQVDLLLRLVPQQGATVVSSGYALIECRCKTDSVGAPELREFAAKCLIHRVSIGIIASWTGITGGRDAFRAAQLTRRRFLVEGMDLLVIDANDLRDALDSSTALASALLRDFEVLRFGKRPTP